MKKIDIANALVESKGFTKKESIEIVDYIIDIIKNEVKSGGIVDIHGLLKIESVYKEAHTARSPKTGEVVNVPAKKMPKIKISAAFKREINE